MNRKTLLWVFGLLVCGAVFVLILQSVKVPQARERPKPKTVIKNTQPVASNLDDEIGSEENNIFFIETNNNLTEFHPKLLCAFESAALHNLDRKVVITYLHFCNKLHVSSLF